MIAYLDRSLSRICAALVFSLSWDHASGCTSRGTRKVDTLKDMNGITEELVVESWYSLVTHIFRQLPAWLYYRENLQGHQLPRLKAWACFLLIWYNCIWYNWLTSPLSSVLIDSWDDGCCWIGERLIIYMLQNMVQFSKPFNMVLFSKPCVSLHQCYPMLDALKIRIQVYWSCCNPIQTAFLQLGSWLSFCKFGLRSTTIQEPVKIEFLNYHKRSQRIIRIIPNKHVSTMVGF